MCRLKQIASPEIIYRLMSLNSSSEITIEIKYNGSTFKNGEDHFAMSLCQGLKKHLVGILSSFRNEIENCKGRVIIDIAKNLECRTRLEHMSDDLKSRINVVLRKNVI